MHTTFPDCLRQLVGIRAACPPDEPGSGLFLDDLEGISLTTAALTASGNDASGLQLLRRKLEHATQAVSADLRAALEQQGSFRWRAELAATQVGGFTGSWLAPSPTARGLRLSRRTSGRLSRIRLRWVELLAQNDAPAVQLSIHDGSQTLVRSLDLTGGQVQRIEIDYVAAAEQVYILAQHPTARFNDSRTAAVGGCGCSQPAARLTGRGWNGLHTTAQTWGLRADALLTCDDWELLCLLRHRLGPLVRERAAADLLAERLYSERMNALTADPDRVRQLRDETRARYDQLLAQLVRQLPELLRGLDADCLACTAARSLHLLP